MTKGPTLTTPSVRAPTQQVETLPHQTGDEMPVLLAPEHLIRSATMPMMLVGAEGFCLLANEAARPLQSALADRHPELIALINCAAVGGEPVNGKVVLSASAGDRHYTVMILPAQDGAAVVMARDASVDDNITRALLRSRELFKDLVTCSADFGWETDARGHFTYVSPAGALGYSADELNGHRASALFADHEAGALSPFETEMPFRSNRFVARDKAGERVYLWISAVPIKDRVGNWLGARGVCRDVTAQIERDAALGNDQTQQAILARIVLAIRTEQSPEHILKKAADATASAMRARAHWVLRSSDGTGEVVSRAGEADDFSEIVEMIAARPEWESQEDAVVQIDSGNSGCLVAYSGEGAGLSGALVLQRDTAKQPWRAHEIELVHAVAGHLGVALSQAGYIEQLQTLSQFDELTGLYNRRAFFYEVDKRIAHQRRTHRYACFLYIDLDYFKQVNDALGHAAGDDVLREVGAILTENTRVGDLAGRIGGDEFAIWLEESSLEGGVGKAQKLIEMDRRLRDLLEVDDQSLSLSVGIAVSHPIHPLSAKELAARADDALYQAKRSGRRCYAIAKEDE